MSASSLYPCASQVSVTAANTRLRKMKHSSNDLIFGRRDQTLVFITLSSGLLSKKSSAISSSFP